MSMTKEFIEQCMSDAAFRDSIIAAAGDPEQLCDIIDEFGYPFDDLDEQELKEAAREAEEPDLFSTGKPVMDSSDAAIQAFFAVLELFGSESAIKAAKEHEKMRKRIEKKEAKRL